MGVRTAGEPEEDAVIETQSELRHPRQHHFQLDAAHDVTAQHVPIGVHLTEEKRAVTAEEPRT